MKCNISQIVTNGSMTGTSVVASDAIPLDQLWGYAIQAVWTGTPVGSIKLQASCDAPNRSQQVSPGLNQPVNWTDIADSSEVVSGPGDYMWNVTTASYRWVRLVYTNSSGTGTLNANLCSKGV